MTTSTLPSAPTTADDYNSLVDLCVQASAHYYGDGDSTLDDATYDQLARWIEEWEQAHPDQVHPNSPTGKVGGGAAPDGDVLHTVPMLSIQKAHSAQDVARWESSLIRVLSRAGRRLEGGYVAEVKLDGASLACRYRQGRLEQLVMRGNHATGEDVSFQIGNILGLPTQLAEPLTLEIRGEVLMTEDQFETANELRRQHNEKAFSNPRNAAAGSLRAQNRPYQVGLTFYSYAVVPLDGVPLDPSVTTHLEQMAAIAALGVQTLAATVVPPAVYTSLEEVTERIAQIAKLRPSLPFGIDGIVVKANSLSVQQAAGSSTHHPYWCTAFKLPPVERRTQLLAVEWNVGRTGNVAPRARLEPVEVDGSVVEYATLHNPKFIQDSGLKIGDYCIVRKQGDIIPRIDAPIVELRTGQETPIELPTVCPQCEGPLDTSGGRWTCAKGTACGLLAAVRYAAGRDQLDIEGLGKVYVEKLVSSGKVSDIADLFTLTREEWSEATGSDKRADSLLLQLDKARKQPLNRVFCALGIVRTGRTLSRHIARHFTTMDAVRAATPDELAEVDVLPGANAPKIAAHLAEMGPVIDKLVKAGVNMTEPTTTVGSGQGPLAGQTVVITGGMVDALASLNRNQLNELTERAGGKPSGSVSSKTTLLVAGANAGSKKTKALELNSKITDEDKKIQILDEDGFAELVRDFLV
ncbi:NAD-dependent DNA ligase LigA [Streptacidiphilus sp. EB103A]|uniref:NAD-dependent DNA ligase LigA n=1 Tax=Streptacidiphilus sp. EB103A TaxID=3156275 RepID=UPI003519B11B